MWKEYLKQITRMQATCNLTLEDIKQRMSRMEDALRSRDSVSTNNSDSLIAEILPLCTVESIQNFDSFLRDTDEAVMHFEKLLCNIQL
ncbi:PREDICTED: uncharacterized protein LOC105558642 isoform X2 [Vollenhovia emeryi]|uniref:uncharacterized protein LOC105558642 isoform X2 n=1 Tax=Vollenhovia emeryi TaxID=411798 RepID=UPI0005F386CE|nr:PREDICTED: uncharacterized protein LOC105558642 isoform X2 [Vollenhovia emeryi]